MIGSRARSSVYRTCRQRSVVGISSGARSSNSDRLVFTGHCAAVESGACDMRAAMVASPARDRQNGGSGCERPRRARYSHASDARQTFVRFSDFHASTGNAQRPIESVAFRNMSGRSHTLCPRPRNRDRIATRQPRMPVRHFPTAVLQRRTAGKTDLRGTERAGVTALATVSSTPVAARRTSRAACA